ncbi:hypothetical protein GGD66_002973 [Bradyrhizobium sp. CIR48]|nr:hypothetical protein [Bradyrhizobium sp. CIR48]MBB4424427.1 hypothetical protein [Bradyrhizobium sp. CIR48]
MDELEHDRYQSRRVLPDMVHLRRAKIVAKPIADFAALADAGSADMEID